MPPSSQSNNNAVLIQLIEISSSSATAALSLANITAIDIFMQYQK